MPLLALRRTGFLRTWAGDASAERRGELHFTGGVRMKIVVLIVRLLLGLVFLVFGLNAFLQFLKGPIPGGLAGQFLQALFQSHYGVAIGAVQALGGAVLLINRYVPLALT